MWICSDFKQFCKWDSWLSSLETQGQPWRSRGEANFLKLSRQGRCQRHHLNLLSRVKISSSKQEPYMTQSHFVYHTDVLRISLSNWEIKPADNFHSDVPNPHQRKSVKFHNTTAAVNRVRALNSRKQNINCSWLLGFPQIQKHGSLTFIAIGMVWLFLSERQGGFFCSYYVTALIFAQVLSFKASYLQRYKLLVQER